ncbi:MAG: hypothetical protein HY072_06325 [Deltaproteobacteria bacterium]|nr:hypothetical protein [Deltaproteobacteria bacterium]
MNSQNEHDRHEGIQDFIRELSDFANTAEETLTKIENDLESNKNLFSVFAEKMFAIRGTSEQLGLPHIAEIAYLGEEISLKGIQAETRPQIRKCVGSLWDALTTVKYLLENYTAETSEEQAILKNRLQDTLKAFGGARPRVNQEEIEKLLNRK